MCYLPIFKCCVCLSRSKPAQSSLFYVPSSVNPMGHYGWSSIDTHMLYLRWSSLAFCRNQVETSLHKPNASPFPFDQKCWIPWSNKKNNKNKKNNNNNSRNGNGNRHGDKKSLSRGGFSTTKLWSQVANQCEREHPPPPTPSLGLYSLWPTQRRVRDGCTCFAISARAGRLGFWLAPTALVLMANKRQYVHWTPCLRSLTPIAPWSEWLPTHHETETLESFKAFQANRSDII